MTWLLNNELNYIFVLKRTGKIAMGGFRCNFTTKRGLKYLQLKLDKPFL